MIFHRISRYSYILPRKKAMLKLAPDLGAKSFVFVAGLHRSGTSILHRQLNEHPCVSGFADTGMPEDEGQHLQDVFKTAIAHGGPGRFAFADSAALDENDARSLTDTEKDRLFRQWGYHWDLGKPVLIEKSPPTLIRSRFFQEIFPRSKFLFVVRHPLPVCLATAKWSLSSVTNLLRHWSRAHEIMLRDFPELRNAKIIRYEDYAKRPLELANQIQIWLDLLPQPVIEPFKNHNKKYFDMVEGTTQLKKLDPCLSITPEKFGYSLSSEMVRSVARDQRFLV